MFLICLRLQKHEIYRNFLALSQNWWVEHAPPSGNILQLWKLSGGNSVNGEARSTVAIQEKCMLDRHAPPALATGGVALAGFLPTHFAGEPIFLRCLCGYQSPCWSGATKSPAERPYIPNLIDFIRIAFNDCA